MAAETTRRICRTSEEIDRAALEDAASDPPLTQAQIDYLAMLWRPVLCRDDAA